MCIYVLQNNLENPFRFYLQLKLMYTSGQLKFTKQEIEFLAFSLELTTKTINSNIKKIEQLNWIRLNTKTKYYHLNSFDKLRTRKNWESRASVEIYFEDIYRIRAILGAALYGYLHKDFWRKVKREKSVQIKGSTYHFLSSSFNYKKHKAPISVNGIREIFNISKPKASRLKKLAFNAGLITVKKQYKKLELDKRGVNYHKKYYPEITKNVIYKNGHYYLQLIDLILPLFNIRKRKKLET